MNDPTSLRLAANLREHYHQLSVRLEKLLKSAHSSSTNSVSQEMEAFWEFAREAEEMREHLQVRWSLEQPASHNLPLFEVESEEAAIRLYRLYGDAAGERLILQNPTYVAISVAREWVSEVQSDGYTLRALLHHKEVAVRQALLWAMRTQAAHARLREVAREVALPYLFQHDRARSVQVAALKLAGHWAPGLARELASDESRLLRLVTPLPQGDVQRELMTEMLRYAPSINPEVLEAVLSYYAEDSQEFYAYRVQVLSALAERRDLSPEYRRRARQGLERAQSYR